ncbi:MAG: hypothetical protein AB7F88_10650 [Pyrinomonadaceae bacterium]
MAKNPDKPDEREYRFNLGDAYPHDQFPIKRLSQYLQEISEIFGDEHVYFVRLEAGSTILVARTQADHVPIVENNLYAVARNEAPETRMAAFRAVDRMLREDNTDGFIIDADSRKVIEFPGVRNELEADPEAERFGPISQYERFTGTPIWVGGEKQLKRVWLRERSGVTRHLNAEEHLASRIAVLMWHHTIRIEGTAKWTREANGKWRLSDFHATDFIEMPEVSLDEDIAALRAHPSKWKELEDPLRELDIIRHDEDIQ